MKRFPPLPAVTAIAGLMLAASVMAGEPPLAAQAVSLSTNAGPPTTAITVSGTGFTPSALVDVYFHTNERSRGISFQLFRKRGRITDLGRAFSNCIAGKK